MIKRILKVVLIFPGIYIIGLMFIYFNQEKFIFLPTKLKPDYSFHFEHIFQEIYLKSIDDKNLHSIYFKTSNPKPKGVIYYLHGNSGDLSGWGNVSDVYLDLGYDVFILDYRGFGKSEGKIKNEKQFYEDVQLGYEHLKKKFDESQIVIVGYSIGTGAASHLASENSPKMLILQAPYYNLTEMAKTRMPFVPSFLLKYKFDNQKQIEMATCPVYIFHGADDKTIFYEDAVKLRNYLKNPENYFTLQGQGHNGINENPEFIEKLKKILGNPILIVQNQKFEAHSVEIYKGNLANPDFSNISFANDKEFVQFIKEGCKKTPINFAGHFTVLQKNCGLYCEHLFIIDRTNGKIYFDFPFSEEYYGFWYRADSRLFILNSNSLDENTSTPEQIERFRPEYYVWNKFNFEFIP